MINKAIEDVFLHTKIHHYNMIIMAEFFGFNFAKGDSKGDSKGNTKGNSFTFPIIGFFGFCRIFLSIDLLPSRNESKEDIAGALVFDKGEEFDTKKLAEKIKNLP